jgi:hypothetical protein
MTCALYALALSLWTTLGGAPPVKPPQCNGGWY